ncbi:MAG TPA: hypothetical protein VE981_00880 [Planctomycetota bacterium]|nr:hypothetical protein [Planctomycetota bacterium]
MAMVKKILWGLLTLGLAGVTGWMGVTEVMSICTDSSLWKSGVPSPDCHVSGKVSTQKFLNSYTLNVSYHDADGGAHEGKTEFRSFTSVDEKKSPEVKYDAKNPSRYVLSWSLDPIGGRWAAAVLFLIVTPLFLIGTVAIFRDKKAAAAPAPPAKDGPPPGSVA